MTIMEAAPIIKNTVTSRQIVEHYGFHPNRGGYICCPFHGEKTASLKVHKSGWYCYGCHEGGDAIEFIRLYERCRFSQAVAKADLYFGLNLVKAEKVSLADIYRRRSEEQEKRKTDHVLKAEKTAFSAHLEKDWLESWERYRDAWSTPARQRNASQWWDMVAAEDALDYIDYIQELVNAADSLPALDALKHKYSKGVYSDAGGHSEHGQQTVDLQADDRDVSDAAGGHVRRLDPAEQALQQARAVC